MAMVRYRAEFLSRESIPVSRGRNADELVGNPTHDNSRYCFARPGEIHLVYLPSGGTTTLDLGSIKGTFAVRWFNPRSGGGLQRGSHERIQGSGKVDLGTPRADAGEDWIIPVQNSPGKNRTRAPSLRQFGIRLNQRFSVAQNLARRSSPCSMTLSAVA